METRSREGFILQNQSVQSRSQRRLYSQMVQGKKFSDGNVNCDNRVGREHDIICSVGLPMICWEQDMVTRHLADDDVRTLMNSSLYFRDILTNKRTLFLSQKVFTVIFTWLCGHFRNSCYYYDRSLTLRKYLFNCRLVCKSWCLSFDQLVQQELTTGNRVVLDLRGAGMRTSSRLCLMSETACVTEFLQHFEKTHSSAHSSNSRSPFITRQLKVSTAYESLMGIDLWTRFFPLFQNYGEHIRHLEFTSGTTVELDESKLSYIKIRKMLMLTPNLITLSLGYACIPGDLKEPTKSFIRDHPLPPLSNLKSLNISMAPSNVVSHILRRYDHVTKLELFHITDEYDCNVKMGKVEDLTVKIKGRQDFRHFANSLAPTWPVKKLNLDFWGSVLNSGKEFLKISSDNWGESCEDLKLSLPCLPSATSVLQKCADFRLHFPKLKVLFLRMNGDLISLDLFIEMKSLERITINRKIVLNNFRRNTEEQGVIFRGKSSDAKRKIKFNGYEKKMYASNIWNLFPKLKYFEVDKMMYRRDEWIQRSFKNP